MRHQNDSERRRKSSPSGAEAARRAEGAYHPPGGWRDPGGHGVLPVLLTDEQAAALCNISRSTLWRLCSEDKIPPPVRIGGSTRWRLQDLIEWIEMGCPPRDRWEAMRRGARGAARRRGRRR